MQLTVSQNIFKCSHSQLSSSLYFNILPCLYEFLIQYTFIDCVAYVNFSSLYFHTWSCLCEIWFIEYLYITLSVRTLIPCILTHCLVYSNFGFLHFYVLPCLCEIWFILFSYMPWMHELKFCISGISCKQEGTKCFCIYRS
jgi:hypothetical protein